MDGTRQYAIAGLSLLAMGYLLFGNGGFRQLVSESLEKRRLTKSLAQLRQEHDRLSHELTLLQQTPAYTEYLIRKQLGYVKKGEVEYRIVKK